MMTIFHHDETTVHITVNLSFISQNQTLVPLPPYSPDLAQCDFLQFYKSSNILVTTDFSTIPGVEIIAGTSSLMFHKLFSYKDKVLDW